jgi:hypothetical protein
MIMKGIMIPKSMTVGRILGCQKGGREGMWLIDRKKKGGSELKRRN